MNRYLAGALGGFLATVPMTIAMERLHRRLPREEQYPLPPREVTEDMIERSPINKPVRDESMVRLTLAAHFAYGAAAGTLFGAPMHTQPRPLLLGAGFGVAVWAASYLGWIPAARVLRPATQHPARRNLLMLAAHCVWGGSTAGIARSLAGPGNHTSAAKRQR